MSLTEQTLAVATSSGSMPTFVVRPSATAAVPAVILYMDVWGIREELRDIARQVAGSGFCCLLPDFYYRFGTVRHEFRDSNGRMKSLRSLTPEQQEQVRAPMRRLSDAMVMDHTAALLELIAGPQMSVEGSVAAIGYCMGGRHALLAGGHFPQRFHLAASLHGSDLVLPGPDSPHLIAARTAAKIYCGFAEHDPYAAPAIMQTMHDEFQRVGAAYDFTLHRDARHGYALPDRDVFDQAATERDWKKMFSVLKNRDSAPAGSRQT
jgi:carboxymethylenebutenolidase